MHPCIPPRPATTSIINKQKLKMYKLYKSTIYGRTIVSGVPNEVAGKCRCSLRLLDNSQTQEKKIHPSVIVDAPSLTDS